MRSASSAGAANLVLGCDLVVTGTKKVLASVKEGQTALVVNTAEVMPGDFTRNADFSLPTERIKRAISTTAGPNWRLVRRRDRDRDGAPRQCDRGQHVHAGLRLSDGPRPAFGRRDRKGDRTQRRGGQDEPRRLHVGAARRRRARDGRASDERAQGADLVAHPLRDARRGDRNDESSSCAATRAPGYARRYKAAVERVRASEAQAAPDSDGIDRGGRALSVQAHGATRTSTKSRGSIPTGISRSRSPRPSRATTCASSSTSRRRCWQEGPGDRRSAQDELRPVDDAAFRVLRAASGRSRHAARHLRLLRRAANRAPADPRV